jgi:hypothetical protein
MKKRLGMFAVLVVLALTLIVVMAPVVFAEEGTSTGFDELGYNDNAGIFVGTADGVDGVLDGAVWGDPTYANDHLVMKWNEAWDEGNADGWTDPVYAAWDTNHWNGNKPGGSGEVENLKIVWTGTEYSRDGVPIWGQFEDIHDKWNGEWIAKTTPAGLGKGLYK